MAGTFEHAVLRRDEPLVLFANSHFKCVDLLTGSDWAVGYRACLTSIADKVMPISSVKAITNIPTEL